MQHLQEVAARRIGQQALTRGWAGWHEQYLGLKRRQQLLVAAGARLTRPKLVASYRVWLHDWSARVLREQKRVVSSAVGEKAHQEKLVHQAQVSDPTLAQRSTA